MKKLIPAISLGLVLILSSWPAFCWSVNLVKDIAVVSGSGPFDFVSAGATMFFTADDNVHGRELWKSDGTEAGTFLVKDVNSIYGNFAEVGAALNGIVYFTTWPEIDNYDLWRSDGTESGTWQVKSLGPGMGTFGLFAGSDRLYFFFINQESGKIELWTSDGTDAGTILLRAFDFPNAGQNFFGEFNGQLYFGASADSQIGLWKSDGTVSGTQFVKSIPGGFPLLPMNFMPALGSLYFLGGDSSGGYSLYKTDGTSSGTVRLAQAIAASQTSRFSRGNALVLPPLTAATGDAVIFAQFTDAGNSFWRTDGTTAGTYMLQSLGNELPYFVGTLPQCVVALIHDASNEKALWRTDGTPAGTTQVRSWSELASEGFSSPCVYGSMIVFDADDGAHGHEPWCSDGTLAGTRLVADIYPGPNTSDIGAWGLMGNRIFMAADDGVHGSELWVAENTAPTAAFSASPQEGDAPLTVQFTDNSVPGSAPITSWLWNFGDDETSSEQNPTHVYNENGAYTVSLTVTTADGSDIAQKQWAVLVGRELPTAGTIALILTTTLIAAAGLRRPKKLSTGP